MTYNREMGLKLQTLLLAVLENNQDELYFNLNQLSPQILSRQHIILASHFSKLFCPEGVYLFSSLMLGKLHCPTMVYSEIYHKLSSTWQKALPPRVAIHHYSDSELQKLSDNFFKMTIHDRIQLLMAATAENPVRFDQRCAAHFMMNTSIQETDHSCSQALIALLELHHLDFEDWSQLFVWLIQHDSIHFGKKLITHLLENPHLTKAQLSTLPWEDWLKRAFYADFLTQELYLRFRFLGLSIAPLVNEIRLHTQQEAKQLLRTITGLGCDVQDRQISKNMFETLTLYCSQIDGGYYESMSIYRDLLQATYLGYIVTPPPELRLRYRLVTQHLRSLGVIGSRTDQSENMLQVFTEPDSTITKKILALLYPEDIKKLTCVCRDFYQAFSPKLTHYPESTAVEGIRTLHLDWVHRLAQLQEMLHRKGLVHPCMQLAVTPSIIVASGIIVWVDLLYRLPDQTGMIFFLSFLGACLAAVLLTLVYRLFSCVPLRDFFPWRPQPYLSFSESFSAEFFIKLFQFKILTDDLKTIFQNLSRHNHDIFHEYSNCIDSLNHIDLPIKRLTHYPKQHSGLFGTRWLEALRQDFSLVDAKNLRMDILRLHDDLKHAPLSWRDELSRKGSIRQTLESYHGRFFKVKTHPERPLIKYRFISDDDDNECTPLTTSVYSSYGGMTSDDVS